MLRPKEIVCKWVDAFNNHDVEAIMSLYHDNATNHQVTNDPVIGIDAIREMFTAEFATADMTAIVENIFEDGQWAILEWKDPLGLRGCGFFHVVNGKILFQYNDPQFLEGRQPETISEEEEAQLLLNAATAQYIKMYSDPAFDRSQTKSGMWAGEQEQRDQIASLSEKVKLASEVAKLKSEAEGIAKEAVSYLGEDSTKLSVQIGNEIDVLLGITTRNFWRVVNQIQCEERNYHGK